MENKKVSLSPTAMMAVKVSLLVFMTLMFLIPLAFIRNLVEERKLRSSDVEREIINLYGGHQTISGPVISIAYSRKYRNQNNDWEDRIDYVYFTPETMNTEIDMTTEIRRRGIYEVPVYNIAVSMNGDFLFPALEKYHINSDTVLWDQSYVSIDLSDMRAVRAAALIEWSGKKYELEGGPSKTQINTQSLYFSLPKMKKGEKYPYSVDLSLRGGKALDFIAVGSKTAISINSDWKSPSFRGAYLPASHNIHDDGFSAEWFVPVMGRNFPESWTYESEMIQKIKSTKFGFGLYTPIDYYHLSERSVKYGLLFIFLPFLCFFLFETLWKLKIHFLQYLLVGAVECVFYLLLLSVSEQAGFTIGFILAAVVTVILITYYAFFFVKSWQKTVFLSGILSISYIFLFIIIQNEDYSLLIGSVGLFLILALVMITTRKIDWYKLSRR